MAVAEAADIKAGERVLDLCAAPGGKSTHAACFNPSLLVSNEIVPSRAKVLAQNIERCGIECGIVTSEAPRTLADKWGETFDVVIADVPCSGEGMFRRREIAVEEWSEVCRKKRGDSAPGGAHDASGRQNNLLHLHFRKRGKRMQRQKLFAKPPRIFPYAHTDRRYSGDNARHRRHRTAPLSAQGEGRRAFRMRDEKGGRIFRPLQNAETFRAKGRGKGV